MIENCPINVELLENKTGEIKIGVYLLSNSEIVNSAMRGKLEIVLYLLLTIIF